MVTAYGVKKEKKALGYSFQEVKGQALVDAKETNVTNALVGKVAGLQIIKGNNQLLLLKLILEGLIP